MAREVAVARAREGRESSGSGVPALLCSITAVVAGVSGVWGRQGQGRSHTRQFTRVLADLDFTFAQHTRRSTG
jgi:hypothetical protein